jgi:hypothetical protein
MPRGRWVFRDTPNKVLYPNFSLDLIKVETVESATGRDSATAENTPHSKLKRDVIVRESPFFEPVQVIVTTSSSTAIKLSGKGLTTNQNHKPILGARRETPDFASPPDRKRAGFLPPTQYADLLDYLRVEHYVDPPGRLHLKADNVLINHPFLLGVQP